MNWPEWNPFNREASRRRIPMRLDGRFPEIIAALGYAFVIVALLAAFALTAFALALAFVTPSRAHDAWANGEPVPAWVAAACCGPEDVHHLRREAVTLTAGGYLLAGYNNGPVAYAAALPSPDGEYWAFWANYPDGSQSRVFCFFAPMGAT